jgi:hypothetical protein
MKLKRIGLAALAGVSALAPTAASAMPNGLPHPERLSSVDQVRWVCNPWGRCWWRPGVRVSMVVPGDMAGTADGAIGKQLLKATLTYDVRGLRASFFVRKNLALGSRIAR